MKKPKIPSSKKKSFLRSYRLPAVVTGASAVVGASASYIQKNQYDLDGVLKPLRELLHPPANADMVDLAARSGESLQKLTQIDESNKWWALLAFLGILVVAIVQFIVAYYRDKDSDQAMPAHRLIGPMIMLEELVRQAKGLSPNDKKFRATIHRVEGKTHEQVLPYVGYRGGDLSKVGRTWPNQCGLVGKLARTSESRDGEPLPLIADMFETVKTDEDYVNALVEMYSYDRDQAILHEKMRLSALAIPITIGDSKTVIGVLYCDSSERGFFDDKIKELCVTAGMAIATIVRNQ